MSKRLRISALALMLLLHNLLVPLSIVSAKADGGSPLVLEDVRLENEAGLPIDAAQYPERVLHAGETFRITYYWMLHSDRQDAESYSFQLPELVHAVSEQGELRTTDQQQAGSYVIASDGTVRLSFDASSSSPVGAPETTESGEAAPDRQPPIAPEGEASGDNSGSMETGHETTEDMTAPTESDDIATDAGNDGEASSAPASSDEAQEGALASEGSAGEAASDQAGSSATSVSTEEAGSANSPAAGEASAHEAPIADEPAATEAAGESEATPDASGTVPDNSPEPSGESGTDSHAVPDSGGQPSEDNTSGGADSGENSAPHEGSEGTPGEPVQGTDDNGAVVRTIQGTLTIEAQLGEVTAGQAYAELVFQLGERIQTIVVPVQQLMLRNMLPSTDSILTSVELRDDNDQLIDSSANPGNRPKLGDPVSVSYTWALENGHGYKAGDTFVFQLPDAFELYNEFDGPLNQYGTFAVTMDGTVTFTFNALVEQRSDISGTFKAETKFSEHTIVGSTRQEIVFPIKDDLKRIPIQFQSASGSELDKRGVPNKPLNPTQIHWSIEMNKAEREIEDPVLSDELPAGLQLDETSVQVYELTVNLDGTVQKGDPVDPAQYTVVPGSGNTYEIRFASAINSAYEVEFATTITDEQLASFENKAQLSGSNIQSQSTSATVSVNHGKPLDKGAAGYNAATQTIQWAIQYNYNEKPITQANAQLLDEFDGSQELVPGTLKVYPITFDESGSPVRGDEVSASDYTLDTATAGQFTLQFNQDIDAAYEVVYATRIQDRVYDDGTVTNRVTWDGETITKTQPIQQVILDKSNGSTNYNAKTTDWTITFNGNHFPMENPVITDTFVGSRLELQPGSLAIRDSQGNTLDVNTHYTLEPYGNGYHEGFVLRLQGTFADHYTITYTTSFDPIVSDTHEYRNQAHIAWVEQSVNMPDKTREAIFSPDNYTRANGFKGGSYNAQTKEVTWTVGLNYNKQLVAAPVVIDYYKGKQKLVAGSLKVHALELDGSANGVIVKDELGSDKYAVDYTLVDGSGNSGFRLTFNDPITTAYQITYKTTVEDEIVASSYDNTATLYDGTSQLAVLNASVPVQHGGEYVAKDGVQNGRAIQWRLDINRGQSTVSNVKVSDAMSANQLLLKASFKLYEAVVAVNGAVSKGSLADEADYSLSFVTLGDGSEGFELTFANTIDRPYILEYQSFVNAISGSTVSNSVKFTGDNVQSAITESQKSYVVRFSTGSGTAVGDLGALEVLKVDAANDAPLAGASFTLYDSTGQIELRSLVTGADGKATFSNLLYDNYVLRESEAPHGYVVGIADTRTVELNAAAIQVKVANKKIIRDVILTKVGEDNRNLGLPGAVYKLQVQHNGGYQDVPGYTSLTTDQNGQIKIQDLDAGSYQFVELTAPQDYVVSGNPVPFTIEAQQTEADEVLAINELQPGAVELTKKDQDDAAVSLAGAVFTLRNAAGNAIRYGLQTNATGKLLVDNLKPGDYSLVETQAPTGYLVNSTPIPFTIDRGQQQTLQIEFTNTRIRNAIELIKVDRFDGSLLAGAEFELRDQHDARVTTDRLGQPLPATFTTDSQGMLLINDLAAGTYKLVETKAPQHYQLDATPHQVVVHNLQTTTVEVENDLIEGSVQLTKVDQYNTAVKLAGAEFRLEYRNGTPVPGVSSVLTTDANGTLLVEHLRPGLYQFVEIKAPADYELRTTPIRFEIVRSQASALQVEARNTLISGGFELTKADSFDQRPLAGAEFKLLDAAGAEVRTGLTTNMQGKLTVTGLQPGSYKLVETSAPFGYVADSTPIDIEIDRDQQQLVTKTFSNAIQLGSVELTKVDSEDHSIVLEGAVYSLEQYDAAADRWNVIRSSLTTDQQGKLAASGLRPGHYRLIETAAPTDYELDTTPIPFAIALGQTAAATLQHSNTLTPGSVELTKVDADEPSLVLEGAEFKLVDALGATVPGYENLVTDSAGKIKVQGLKPGAYSFIETKAPQHYMLSATPLAFTIDKGQQTAKQIDAANELIDGAVELTKVDAQDNTLPLEGAEFKLLNAQDVELASGLTTNAEGKLVVNHLRPGSYKLIETKAPEHYRLDQTPVTFTISYSQTAVVERTVTNELIRGAVELTKQDADVTGMVIAGAVFELRDAQNQMMLSGLTTDASGKITVSDLLPGDYRFVETSAAPGYVLDTTAVAFTIVKNQQETLAVSKSNARMTGAVELTKVDELDASLTLPGAVFELRDGSDQTLRSGLTTDQDGKLRVAGLKPGVYALVETAAPKHYVVSTTPVSFTIPFNPQQAVELTVANKLDRGAVELTKVDTDDADRVLAGAEFKLLNAQGVEVASGLTTNAQGKLLIDELVPGRYELIETKAPADYVLDATPIRFEIVRSQASALQVEARNTLISGGFELTKIDSFDQRPLAGAAFKLLDAANTEIRSSLTTNAQGKLTVTDLQPGSYKLVETSAPFGYVADSTPIDIEIVRDQQQLVTKTFSNAIQLGSVELTKVDSEDHSIVLEGAVYSLEQYDAAADHWNVIRSSLTTDQQGKLAASGLRPGHYRLIETAAPANYERDTTPIPFAIALGQTAAATLQHSNTLTPGSVELTKVDADEQSIVLAGAEFKLVDALGATVPGYENLVTDSTGKITVQGLKPGAYSFIETKSPQHYVMLTTPVAFTIDKGQQTVKQVVAANEIIDGAVELTKVDAQDNTLPLEGAEFKLLNAQDVELASGLTTNAEGKLVVNHLRPGSYKLVETKAPEHYKLDETPVTFTISYSQTAVVERTVTNELIRGAVELTKQDADVTGMVIAGAVFELRDAQNQMMLSGLTTDASGKITVSDLLPGDYRFVETSAAPGYVLDTTPVAFTIVKNQQEMLAVSKSNARMTGAVELTKVDELDASLTLPGAVFELRDGSGQTLRSGLTTDQDGKLRVAGLKPGVYALVETAAPEHYVVSPTLINFTIPFNPQQAVELTVANKLDRGAVELTKRDADHADRVLAGAEFKLLNAQGVEVASGLTTNAQGKLLIDELVPGRYELIETKAPANYELDSTPISFDIVKSQQQTLSISFENTLTPGAVELLKVDADNHNAPLAGAVFAIMNEAGVEVYSGLTTGNDGLIVADQLKPGTYQLVETAAPAGYDRLAAPITFTIVEGQQETLRVQVSNEQTTGSVQLTKVDQNNKTRMLKGAQFTLRQADGTVVHTGLETDDNGQLVVDGLKPGNYELVETKSPSGYRLDATPIRFTIDFNPQAAVELTVTNQYNVYYPSQPTNPEPSTPVEGGEGGTTPDPGQPGETPGNETPGNETPGNEAPGTKTPGGETPGTQTPGTKTPEGETPGTENPGIETPRTGTPEPGDQEPEQPDSSDDEDHPITEDNGNGGNGDGSSTTPDPSGNGAGGHDGAEHSGNGQNGDGDSTGIDRSGAEHSGAGSNGDREVNGGQALSGSGAELPRTGEEASYTTLIMGMLAIAAGAWLLLGRSPAVRRRR
ncbi:SpaA isopeptide-forming pilin-related protein [Paenibacillus sp. SYP-B4298]|uniref:SpaA isopeptide-forming pilin-related protein n=1 Tax=Paenibacillus sp. SYP-B4298 TaxID=2996034 RepID=UPI0022DE0A9B|nr:SpaA isopeptide-forming pilin-related protein [Paenibacillus sp. SYP-B4298]